MTAPRDQSASSFQCKKPALTLLKLCVQIEQAVKSAGHLQTSPPRLHCVFARCWLLTKDIEQQCCKITTAQTSLVIIRTQLKHGARCSVKAFLHRSAVRQQMDRHHQTDKLGGGHSSPNSLDLLRFSTKPSYILVAYTLYGLRACAGRTRK